MRKKSYENFDIRHHPWTPLKEVPEKRIVAWKALWKKLTAARPPQPKNHYAVEGVGRSIPQMEIIWDTRLEWHSQYKTYAQQLSVFCTQLTENAKIWVDIGSKSKLSSETLPDIKQVLAKLEALKTRVEVFVETIMDHFFDTGKDMPVNSSDWAALSDWESQRILGALMSNTVVADFDTEVRNIDKEMRAVFKDILKVHARAFNTTSISYYRRERRKHPEVAETISTQDVQELRAWWKKQIKAPTSEDPHVYLSFLRKVKDALEKLAKYVMLSKGLGYLDDIAPDILVELQKRFKDVLSTARHAIDDTIHYVNFTIEVSTPGSREFKMSRGQYESQLGTPEDVLKTVRTVVQHDIKTLDDTVSRSLLRTLSQHINKYKQPVETVAIEKTINLGNLTLVWQGEALDYPDAPFVDNHREEIVITEMKKFVGPLIKAKRLLEQKGLGKLWYGKIYVRCRGCAGVNPNVENPDTFGGVGGDYNPQADVIRFFMHPTDFATDAVIHELGHRYYYRFMDQTARRRFDSFFNKVMPVSTYGGSNEREDFAEVFTWYVMNRKLSRDQLERFKEFLGWNQGGRRANIVTHNRRHRAFPEKSSMGNLRSNLIHLAHQNPDLRKDLLPLLRVAAAIFIVSDAYITLVYDIDGATNLALFNDHGFTQSFAKRLSVFPAFKRFIELEQTRATGNSVSFKFYVNNWVPEQLWRSLEADRPEDAETRITDIIDDGISRLAKMLWRKDPGLRKALFGRSNPSLSRVDIDWDRKES